MTTVESLNRPAYRGAKGRRWQMEDGGADSWASRQQRPTPLQRAPLRLCHLHRPSRKLKSILFFIHLNSLNSNHNGNFRRQKTPRSFLKPATFPFPKILKFADKQASFNPENHFVSTFVSRSFQFPYYTLKNGNFGSQFGL
jgi:hypothetical protein